MATFSIQYSKGRANMLGDEQLRNQKYLVSESINPGLHGMAMYIIVPVIVAIIILK